MQVKTIDGVSATTNKKSTSNPTSSAPNPYANMSQAEINARINHTAPGSTVNAAYGKTATGGSTGGSKGGSGGSNDAYISALMAQLSQPNTTDIYYQQMKAAAQDAYNRGMDALNSAYGEQMNSLNSNLKSTKSQLLNSYNNSKQNITDDATNSLKQAYINKMLSQKNLGQQMSAQGLSGGATETTLASMQNNYGNARNNINTTANKNLTNLEQNYNDNLAQAMQAYNSAVAQANLAKAQQAIQLENALANNQIAALGDYQSYLQSANSDYMDLLKSALSKAKNFTFDPSTFANFGNAAAVTQAAPTNASTNYALLQALSNGANTPSSYSNAGSGANTVSNASYLSSLLSQLQNA